MEAASAVRVPWGTLLGIVRADVASAPGRLDDAGHICATLRSTGWVGGAWTERLCTIPKLCKICSGARLPEHFETVVHVGFIVCVGGGRARSKPVRADGPWRWGSHAHASCAAKVAHTSCCMIAGWGFRAARRAGRVAAGVEHALACAPPTIRSAIARQELVHRQFMSCAVVQLPTIGRTSCCTGAIFAPVCFATNRIFCDPWRPSLGSCLLVATPPSNRASRQSNSFASEREPIGGWAEAVGASAAAARPLVVWLSMVRRASGHALRKTIDSILQTAVLESATLRQKLQGGPAMIKAPHTP